MVDGGPALFRLVRFWSRRWARGVAVGVTGGAGVGADGGADGGTDGGTGGGTDTEASLPQHVLVVDAVATLRRAGAEPSVGDVAEQLGLDRSGASRMVAAAAGRGYLERRRARADARRSVLELTARGRELLADSLRWQRSTFLDLTAGWSAADRTRFAGYLERLAREVGA